MMAPFMKGIKTYDKFRNICIESVGADIVLLIDNNNQHILLALEIINSEAGHYTTKTDVN